MNSSINFKDAILVSLARDVWVTEVYVSDVCERMSSNSTLSLDLFNEIFSELIHDGFIEASVKLAARESGMNRYAYTYRLSEKGQIRCDTLTNTPSTSERQREKSEAMRKWHQAWLAANPQPYAIVGTSPKATSHSNAHGQGKKTIKQGEPRA